MKLIRFNNSACKKGRQEFRRHAWELPRGLASNNSEKAKKKVKEKYDNGQNESGGLETAGQVPAVVIVVVLLLVGFGRWVGLVVGFRLVDLGGVHQ